MSELLKKCSERAIELQNTFNAKYAEIQKLKNDLKTYEADLEAINGAMMDNEFWRNQLAAEEKDVDLIIKRDESITEEQLEQAIKLANKKG